MLGLFRKKKLHNRMLVLSALPDNKTDFDKYAKSEESDFLASLSRTFNTDDASEIWNRYECTAQKLLTTLAYIEKIGGTVVHDFNLSDMRMMLNYDSVIVIAHHSDVSDEIEIRGQLIPTKRFVESIPMDCELHLDMTSCFSAYLIPRIKVRIPKSRIIGIDIKTSLSTRLDVLRKIVDLLFNGKYEKYVDAAIVAWQDCLEQPSSNVAYKNSNDKIYLGGTLQSTVYAPNEAIRGEDFIVSIFVHKSGDRDEIEIRAKGIDESLQKKNELKLKTKLKRGDVLDFQMTTNATTDFTVDEKIKSIIWDNEIESVEFIISVSHDCSSTQFVGKIKTAVNKSKVGDMIFKTKIVDKKDVAGAIPCANFEFVRYDAMQETIEQGKILNNNIQTRKKELASIVPPTEGIRQEMEMCDKCIELLHSDINKAKHSRLEVFISSTSDMKIYREVIREQVEACEMYPDMYEKWGQGNDYPRDMCCKHVLNSDIFVCILGEKYGFVEPMWNKSMTEIEYRIAANAGIPILVYILDGKNGYNPESDENMERQESLRNELKSNRLVGLFKSELSLRLMANRELLILKSKLQ